MACKRFSNMLTIHLSRGDITKMEVDAIVNAANSALAGGGGVDGAIHRAGGPAIMDACSKIRSAQGGCPTGHAVITTAGKLPAKYVIHAVGPVWRGGGNDEEKLLRNAYQASLHYVNEYSLKSIAFPNISTGVYGFPKQLAAQLAVDTLKGRLEDFPQLEDLYFVCFDEENYKIYKDQLTDLSSLARLDFSS